MQRLSIYMDTGYRGQRNKTAVLYFSVTLNPTRPQPVLVVYGCYLALRMICDKLVNTANLILRLEHQAEEQVSLTYSVT